MDAVKNILFALMWFAILGGVLGAALAFAAKLSDAASPAAAAANSSPANSVLRTVKGMLRCSPGANSTSEASAKATSS